jgi:ABC-type multidrug transport system permease subunit
VPLDEIFSTARQISSALPNYNYVAANDYIFEAFNFMYNYTHRDTLEFLKVPLIVSTRK